MLCVSDDPATDLRVFSKEMQMRLPNNWTASAFIWEELQRGKRFHARYILTDVGGVGSDFGLDEGKSQGDETDLYLLPDGLRAKRTVEFSTEGNTFTLAAGPLDFLGIGG